MKTVLIIGAVAAAAFVVWYLVSKRSMTVASGTAPVMTDKPTASFIVGKSYYYDGGPPK